MPKASLEHQDIVELLAKLKDATPDYPPDLVETRKASYLKKIVEIELSRKEQGGGGGKGGSAGSSKAALGGGAAAQGLSFKAAIAVGLLVAMLTATYLFRDQIVNFLEENNIIAEETATPLVVPAPAGLTTEIPPFNGSSTGVELTGNIPGFETDNLGGTPENATESPGHGFDQTPGTPTPQDRGSPFNVFQYLICILQPEAASCQ